MATAQTLITRALRLLSVIGSGVTPDSNALADGLTALNAMLEGWRNQPWASWSIDEVTGSIVANQQSYTLGPAGNINTTRPINIENARFQLLGVDYPLQVIDQAQWAGIRVKGLKSNIPRYIYPTGDYPLVTLNLWPIPTQTATLILGVVHPLSGISALGDTVSLPPGYEQAIAYNLAICLAPEFGVSASGEVVQIAKKSLAEIKRMNSQTITSDLGLLAGRKYNIYADF